MAKVQDIAPPIVHHQVVLGTVVVVTMVTAGRTKVQDTAPPMVHLLTPLCTVLVESMVMVASWIITQSQNGDQDLSTSLYRQMLFLIS